MKILHTSDWHLGKNIYGYDLIENQKHFIYQNLYPAIQKEEPDIIVIAGDIFDRSIASVNSIRLFDSVVTEISKKYKIPLFVITGNHDSGERMSLAKELLKKSNVFITTNLKESKEIIPFITKNGQKVNVCMLPYFGINEGLDYLKTFATNKDNLLDQPSAKPSYSEVFNQIVKQNFCHKKNDDAINILLSHGFVAGSSALINEEPLTLGTAENITPCFNDFDYVAMGHLHLTQKHLGKKFVYSGSPLKYSFDDRSKQKNMIIAEVTKDKLKSSSELLIKELHITPLNDMRTLKGSFKEVLEVAKHQPSSDFLCIELTNALPVFMPMEQLRVYYPNVMMIKNNYLKPYSGSTQTDQYDTKNNFVLDEDLFENFLKEVCDITPAEPDYHWFLKAKT